MHQSGSEHYLLGVARSARRNPVKERDHAEWHCAGRGHGRGRMPSERANPVWKRYFPVAAALLRRSMRAISRVGEGLFPPCRVTGIPP